MIYKFAHISDTHIRNESRKEEYEKIFEELYSSLRAEEPNLIVHTGDLAHSKLSLSPEYFELSQQFIYNLSQIAPVLMILGNHDCNLTNKDRIDAISPILNALKRDSKCRNVHYLKYSGDFSFGEDVNFRCLSLLDKRNWDLKNVDENKINIALYHGAVEGCATDNGIVLTNTELKISDFDAFDYVMLGDIHKTYQKLNVSGTILYPGSTVQQNFAETDDKGYTIWEIKDKKLFKTRHVSLENPYPFKTVEIDKNENLSDNDIPLGSRLRIQCYAGWTSERRNQYVREMIEKYKLKSCKINQKVVEVESLATLDDEELPDVSKLDTQDILIEKYLENLDYKKEKISQIIALNRTFGPAEEEENQIKYGTRWRVKKISWDNLFSYGKGNSIDFTKKSGVLGIFGKNYTGKSSVVETITFALFGKTAKNTKKLFNIINWDKDDAKIMIDLDINGIPHRITKDLKKINVDNKRASEKVVFTNLKTGEILTKESKDDTLKFIRSYLGNLDEFMMTNYLSQSGRDNFISEGSTQRKNIFSKFLQLDSLEKRFKRIKEKEKEAKTLLKTKYHEDKKSSVMDITRKIRDLKNEEKRASEEIKQLSGVSEELLVEISKMEERAKIMLNEKEVKERITRQERKISDIEKENVILRDICSEREASLLEIGELPNVSDLLKEREQYDKILSLKQSHERTGKQKKKEKERAERDIQILDKVPCKGQSEYVGCQFLKEALSQKTNLEKIEKELVEVRSEYRKVSQELAEIKISDINEKIKSYDSTNKLINKLKRELDANQSKLSANLKTIEFEKQTLEEMRQQCGMCEVDDQFLHNIAEKKKERERIKRDISTISGNRQITLFQISSLQSDKQSVVEYLKEQRDLNERFENLTILAKAFHSNGIGLMIINSAIPKVNEETSKFLDSIGDFNLEISLENKNLEINILKDNGVEYPIELGSGSEKSIASLALRLSIIKLSSYPKSNIFILDEPGTDFDQDHLVEFAALLRETKSEFENVIIISHLDALRDCVDGEMNVSKRKYSKIK